MEKIDTIIAFKMDGKFCTYGKHIISTGKNTGYRFKGFIYKNEVYLHVYDIARMLGFSEWIDNGDSEIVYWNKFYPIYKKALDKLGLNKDNYPIPIEYNKNLTKGGLYIFQNLSESIIYQILKDNNCFDKNNTEDILNVLKDIRKYRINELQTGLNL